MSQIAYINSFIQDPGQGPDAKEVVLVLVLA